MKLKFSLFQFFLEYVLLTILFDTVGPLSVRRLCEEQLDNVQKNNINRDVSNKFSRLVFVINQKEIMHILC